MTYILLENTNKLTVCCIAYPVPCKAIASGSVSVKASGLVNQLSGADYEFEYHSNATQNQTLNGPFILNGTYYFHFPNSKTIGDQVLLVLGKRLTKNTDPFLILYSFESRNLLATH